MKLVTTDARDTIFNKSQFPNPLYAHQKLLKLKITDLISSDKQSLESFHLPVQRSTEIETKHPVLSATFLVSICGRN
jgi:hypothetical protein